MGSGKLQSLREQIEISSGNRQNVESVMRKCREKE